VNREPGRVIPGWRNLVFRIVLALLVTLIFALAFVLSFTPGVPLPPDPPAWHYAVVFALSLFNSWLVYPVIKLWIDKDHEKG
jgi:hypothetical protein